MKVYVDELPKGCYCCPFKNYTGSRDRYGYCVLTREYHFDGDEYIQCKQGAERLEQCPLKVVPKTENECKEKDVAREILTRLFDIYATIGPIGLEIINNLSVEYKIDEE